MLGDKFYAAKSIDYQVKEGIFIVNFYFLVHSFLSETEHRVVVLQKAGLNCLEQSLSQAFLFEEEVMLAAFGVFKDDLHQILQPSEDVPKSLAEGL